MPSWVTFDSTQLKISGKAPLVNVTTNYTFYFETIWTDNFAVTVQKPVTIQVINFVPIQVEDVEDVENVENVETTTAGTLAIIISQI
jgi:hypothetical protein